MEKKKEKHKRSKISRSVQLFCFVSLFVCFSLCVDGLAERQKLHPDGSRESAPQFCGYHIKYSSGKGSLSLSLSLSLSSAQKPFPAGEYTHWDFSGTRSSAATRSSITKLIVFT